MPGRVQYGEQAFCAGDECLALVKELLDLDHEHEGVKGILSFNLYFIS